jgi:hypothetical protein
MQGKKQLYLHWTLSSILILASFYLTVHWLSSAAEVSAAASLETQVVSALS